MDPLVVSAGVGLLSGMFGGKPKTPGYVKENYQLQNDLFKRAMGLYDNTDLAAVDQSAITAYSDSTMQEALKFLQNYDALAAGSGSAIGKSDTRKDRSRAQIASDSASKVGSLEASLISSRPNRQAALLPSVGSVAQGVPAAAYLDQQVADQNQQQMQGILDAAQVIGTLWPTKSATGQNDRNNWWKGLGMKWGR